MNVLQEKNPLFVLLHVKAVIKRKVRNGKTFELKCITENTKNLNEASEALGGVAGPKNDGTGFQKVVGASSS